MIEQQAERATYAAGTIGAFFGAFTLKDWFMVASILSIVVTYGTNLYFKARADRRDRERLELRREEHDRETD